MENIINISNTALAKFSEAKEQIVLLTAKCKNVIINNPEGLESAKKLAKTAKKVETLIEDKRKEITAPILTEKKRIDDFAKSLTVELNSAIASLRNQILSFEKKLEAERIAEQKRLEEEQRKLEESLNKSVISGIDTEELQQESQRLLELREQANEIGSNQSSAVRKVWSFEVIDEKLVPIEYLSINERKIKEAITAGIRDINGIKIFQKEQLVLR